MNSYQPLSTFRKWTLHKTVLAACAAFVADAGELSAQVYEPGAIVEGRSIGDWAIDYWFWGEREGATVDRPPLGGQTGPVLFLKPSSPSGNWSFELPTGVPIFLSFGGDIAWNKGGLAGNQQVANGGGWSPRDFMLDDFSLTRSELFARREEPSAPFLYQGDPNAWTERYTVMVEPLSPGDHVLEWHTQSGGNIFGARANITVVEPATVPLTLGQTYTQNFDSLGTDGAATSPLPNAWSVTDEHAFILFQRGTNSEFPAATSIRGTGPFALNAGEAQAEDRALAIYKPNRNSRGETIQLLATSPATDVNALQLAFDIEAWDAGIVRTLGEAAFDVTIEVDAGDGYEPLVDLGRIGTGEVLFPPAGEYINGNHDSNRISYDSGRIDANIPADSRLRLHWAASDGATNNWVFGLDNVSFTLFGDEILSQLVAGDADQDFDFDQLDLVKVQIASKYLTGQAATWGEGDWDGAPGGSAGNPPAGDGLFNQFDIIAAQQGAAYLTGPYAAIGANGQSGDGQTSIVYSPVTGELSVDAPAGVQLTSINIDSAAGIFTGSAAQSLGGSFDNDADGNIFKATFGGSFGSLSFGNVAQAGLSQEFVLNDLTVVGSLAGGGGLGNVDLVYVPEPASALLVLMGFAFAIRAIRRID